MKHTDEKGRHTPAQSNIVRKMRGENFDLMKPIHVPLDHPLLRKAKKAKDGEHYVPDPRREGKYMRVD